MKIRFDIFLNIPYGITEFPWLNSRNISEKVSSHRCAGIFLARSD
jgi:hypothetical protein